MKIEKGIEIPAQRRRGRWDFLLQMEVGDSFLMDVSDTNKRTWGGYCTRWAKQHNLNWKFTQRATPEGLRVWRVE